MRVTICDKCGKRITSNPLRNSGAPDFVVVKPEGWVFTKEEEEKDPWVGKLGYLGTSYEWCIECWNEMIGVKN